MYYQMIHTQRATVILESREFEKETIGFWVLGIAFIVMACTTLLLVYATIMVNIFKILISLFKTYSIYNAEEIRVLVTVFSGIWLENSFFHFGLQARTLWLHLPIEPSGKKRQMIISSPPQHRPVSGSSGK